MADDGSKLSQQELAEVLQRAAERESREGPRSFDAAEVVQAGRELGLSAGTVEAEMKALLLRKQALPERNRPFDTHVVVEATPDRFVLRIPARGVHLAALAKGAFSVFGLSITALWMWMSWQLSPVGQPSLLPLFALPFWAAGLGLAGSAVFSMIRSRRLQLDRNGGTLVSRPLGITRKLHTRELSVRLDRLRRRAGNNEQFTETPVLLLEHGTRTFALLEGFSEAEQRWVKAELDHWLAD